MTKSKKILGFVTDGDYFLILRNNPKDPNHGGDLWFTVTGEVESGEDGPEAVTREIKEETGLKVKKVFFLNWISRYKANGVDHEEYNYLAFVDKGEIKLNEEHIDHEWLPLGKMVERIYWTSDKMILKRVLECGLREESFFSDIMVE